MIMPCPNRITCPGTDEPIENLSSETPDIYTFPSEIWLPPIIPPITGNPSWDRLWCLGVCHSTVSQQDADDCAARNAYLCAHPNGPVFFNGTALAQLKCSDGSIFYFVMPGGTFVGATQAEADAAAQAAANKRAPPFKFCCASVPCLCAGTVYGFAPGNAPPAILQLFQDATTTPATGGPFIITVETGTIPLGLTLVSTGQPATFYFTGVSLVPALTSVVFRITDRYGNYLLKTVFIKVIGITTTTLTPYTVGVPYSFQLLATGGGGNYAWKIDSGALPTGLSMDIHGLITGTPTVGGTFNFTPSVIDTDCVATDKTFFPPKVKMTTASMTTIATVVGFSEFGTPSVPPKKYMNLSQTGYSNAWFNVDSGGFKFAGEARYDYAGTSSIDNTGALISQRTVTYSDSQNPPPAGGFDVTTPSSTALLKGWYFTPANPPNPPNAHSPTPLIAISTSTVGPFVSDLFEAAGPNAEPYRGMTVDDSMHAHDIFSGVALRFVSPVGGGPIFTTVCNWDHNYAATLDTEYTDALALAQAKHYGGNGAVAQNAPRTTGFISIYTTVSFALAFSNLLAGELYVASVDFLDTNTGTKTTRTYNFTAAAPTYSIVDSVPFPAAQHATEVRNPQVAFAP